MLTRAARTQKRPASADTGLFTNTKNYAVTGSALSGLIPNSLIAAAAFFLSNLPKLANCDKAAAMHSASTSKELAEGDNLAEGG